MVKSKCSFCNTPIDNLIVQFKCTRCNETFCTAHRLPENHKCDGLGFSNGRPDVKYHQRT